MPRPRPDPQLRPTRSESGKSTREARLGAGPLREGPERTKRKRQLIKQIGERLEELHTCCEVLCLASYVHWKDGRYKTDVIASPELSAATGPSQLNLEQYLPAIVVRHKTQQQCADDLARAPVDGAAAVAEPAGVGGSLRVLGEQDENSGSGSGGDSDDEPDAAPQPAADTAANGDLPSTTTGRGNAEPATTAAAPLRPSALSRQNIVLGAASPPHTHHQPNPAPARRVSFAAPLQPPANAGTQLAESPLTQHLGDARVASQQQHPASIDEDEVMEEPFPTSARGGPSASAVAPLADEEGPAFFKEGRLWFTKDGTLIELVEPVSSSRQLNKEYKEDCKLFISQLLRMSAPLPDTPKVLVEAEKEVKAKNWPYLQPIITAMRSGRWQSNDARRVLKPAGQIKFEELRGAWYRGALSRDGEWEMEALGAREKERGVWQVVRGPEAWAGWELAEPERDPAGQPIAMSQYKLWVQPDGQKQFCRLHTATKGFITFWWKHVGQLLEMLGRLAHRSTDLAYREAVQKWCFEVRNAEWTAAEVNFDIQHSKMLVLSDHDDAAWLAAAGNPTDPHPNLDFARRARLSAIASDADQAAAPSSALPASPDGNSAASPSGTGLCARLAP